MELAQQRIRTILLRHTKKRSPSPKADDHKILLQLMLGFCGVVVLMWRTIKEYAARCEVCIKVGPSSSIPSSVSQEIVLSVTTSGWFYNVLELFLLILPSFHCLLRPVDVRQSRWSDVQTFDGSLSTRYGKICMISSTSENQKRVECQIM